METLSKLNRHRCKEIKKVDKECVFDDIEIIYDVVSGRWRMCVDNIDGDYTSVFIDVCPFCGKKL